MEVGVLGPLRIRDGDREIPAGGPRQRRLLERLAIAGGHAVSVDELEAAVWGDEAPSTVRHTVATHVSRLRRLGLSISSAGDGYRLTTPTDLQKFERLADESRRVPIDDPSHAMTLLRDALESWRGRPCPDLDHQTVGQVEAARLEDRADGMREDLLALELDHGGQPDPIGVARRLTAEQPYRERRWELWMLALYRSGRQAEALDVYAACRRRLVDDLGIEPGPGLRRMQQAVLSQDPALDAASPRESVLRSSPRLPGTSTRLIGRAQEQRALSEVWDRARAATLVGPPGAGKTRLAVEMARAASPPVWWVSLDQVPAEESVAAAVLHVVAPSSRAIDAHDGTIHVLADATGLLVLDGCEPRLAEVALEVDSLLRTCPSLRILATSRERLGIFDEALIPLGPLGDSDALELLVDRAKLVDPQFELRPDEVGTADRLCGLVDRLPLGLELVARHLNLLRLDELTDRVEADLSRWAGGPTGGRSGLWAALDASTARLNERERRVMTALAVMAADADAGLVAEVADPPAVDLDVFDVIAHLVDASLVQVRSAVAATRYELLHTVAVHTLETHDGALVASARERYRDAVLARAETLAGSLATPERTAALAALDLEIPHIRAVIAQCAGAIESNQGERALTVVVALTEYWLGRHPAEGLAWLARLREAASPLTTLRAESMLSAAHLAYWLTDFATGRETSEEARALFETIGDALGEGRALRRLGAIAAATDDIEDARRYLEASLARLEETGVEREIGTTLLHLGSLLADQGQTDAALLALERALAVATTSGDPLARGHALAALNLAHWKGGHLDAAMQAGDEALTLFRELGHRPTEGTVSYRMAAIARGSGRPRASRGYALQAIAAGEEASTRTTIAFGHIAVARLDLDAGELADAAAHLFEALAILDPVSDRWVLADALEAVARLAVETDTDAASDLLVDAAAIRNEIHQPVAPTETADVDTTRGATRHRLSVTGDPPDAARTTAKAQEIALAIARDLRRHAEAPTPLRRKAR